MVFADVRGVNTLSLTSLNAEMCTISCPAQAKPAPGHAG